MYQFLLVSHSIVRWAVVVALIFAIWRSCKGYRAGATFSSFDNKVRHWTATILHIQLMIGILLYAKSPLVHYFWNHFSTSIKNSEARFAGLIHIVMMLSSVVIISAGSALAKRKPTDQGKYKTMFWWYLIGFLLILLAIPWPFSPLAHRPLIRLF